MNVKELIEKLSAMDAESEVRVNAGIGDDTYDLDIETVETEAGVVHVTTTPE